MRQGENSDLQAHRITSQIYPSLLREALIDLIDEKGLDAVTVGEISERAMINRATFYRHYQDKYEVADRQGKELDSNGSSKTASI